MRCAIVNTETRIVVEVVVADPATDKAPRGHELVAIDDDVTCEPGWMYSTARGLLMTPEIEAKIAAQIEADAKHPDVVMIRSIETDPNAFLDDVEAGRG